MIEPHRDVRRPVGSDVGEGGQERNICVFVELPGARVEDEITQTDDIVLFAIPDEVQQKRVSAAALVEKAEQSEGSLLAPSPGFVGIMHLPAKLASCELNQNWRECGWLGHQRQSTSGERVGAGAADEMRKE
jgi:hypothetical protein